MTMPVDPVLIDEQVVEPKGEVFKWAEIDVDGNVLNTIVADDAHIAERVALDPTVSFKKIDDVVVSPGDVYDIAQDSYTTPPPPFEVLQPAMLLAVEARTGELVATGVEFQVGRFAVDNDAAVKVIGLVQAEQMKILTYPVECMSLDGTALTLKDADALLAFYATLFGYRKMVEDGATQLRIAILGSQDQAALLGIVDNR